MPFLVDPAHKLCAHQRIQVVQALAPHKPTSNSLDYLVHVHALPVQVQLLQDLLNRATVRVALVPDWQPVDDTARLQHRSAAVCLDNNAFLLLLSAWFNAAWDASASVWLLGFGWWGQQRDGFWMHGLRRWCGWPLQEARTSPCSVPLGTPCTRC
ncbi:hypothetical protein DL89DRAFT_143505 [Linderina pennispora]|uniref:Uncharacterized protein n=1 Tax=Linderina pennispora TaxID=61395 RepID=A0A1Y1WC89_9FUNG|nr:uncharacterized protein DL89DRAFT_143505 [Linderina pennispora]ORX70948.1 hypothetical protein DL89DRAFT_143505 [Linderina pennispora]